MSAVRTRFAPSPTGDLHLGGAFTALASWVLARQARGAFVLRVEDLDRPRVVPGAEERLLEDLRWLGLDWDEGPGNLEPHGPYRQTERLAHYDAALAELTAQGRTYPCDCSRAEIARVASAPHAGEETRYPGTCRDKDPSRTFRRPPATRLRLAPADGVRFVDRVAGPIYTPLLEEAGEFVLRRGDGVYAYQLAVSADDLAMGITDVVRGEDLIPSTPRQIFLMRLWHPHATAASGARHGPPRYWHLPLVAAPDGSRLAKRTDGTTVRELRASGLRPESVVGHLASALGLQPSPTPASPRALVASLRRRPAFRIEPWRIPTEFEPASDPKGP